MLLSIFFLGFIAVSLASLVFQQTRDLYNDFKNDNL